MKRTFGLARTWLIAFCAISAISGCTRHDSPDSTISRTIEKPITKISMAVQAFADTEEMERQIANFNTSHPDWLVELIKIPHDNYDITLNRLMTSGKGPDVFQLNTLWLNSYISKEWLLDLSDESFEGMTYPKWATEYTKQKNGRYYAIPTGMNTLRLIYNKELLDGAGCDSTRPPSTLSEMKDCAIKISTAGTGFRRYGFALPGGDDETGFRRPLEIAGTLSGVYYYDFRKGKFDFSVYEPWFRTILEMKSKGGLFPGEISLKNDTALSQFAEGNIGMMYATNSDIAQLFRMNPMNFSWGTTMPPLLDSSKADKGALMIDIEPPFVINTFTVHKQEAFELLRFLLSREFQGALYEQGDVIPTLTTITGNPQYQTSPPNLEAFLPRSNESPYPKEPKFGLADSGSSVASSIWGDEARMKTYREILQGAKQPDSALKEMTQKFNTSLDLAIYNQLIGENQYVFPNFDPKNPLKYANTPDEIRNGSVLIH
ncbi:ABC transporter substrate-binding protein [Cohnella mopanensis]|uniref:ABC transporter substrate-binding protein n=1 Tax=Cohnella mopanensis TaxID=2911966 RepID=UPI001EF7C8AB|nr:extracellular solute-binding protein [Cohnella mopanensis]